jgi:pyruvate dehydrogenase E2 component (dihydrolipoamide acetyltransferase)
MATAIKMPQLGLTMTEGTIGVWLKQEGDVIKKGDVVVEITTDKLVSEVTSEVDGVLRKICAEEGEDVPVQGLLAIVGDADEEIALDSNANKIEEKNVQDTEVKQGNQIKASPLAKKVAAKKGIDLTKIMGSGYGGRIIRKDVLAQEQAEENVDIQANPSAVPQEEGADISRPLTRMRKVIGKRMTESKHSAPHVTLTTEAIVNKTIELRKHLHNKNSDIHLSYTDILVKMAATALRHLPIINASIDNDQMIIRDRIHIGVAVALEEGLLVPVVRDADRKGFAAISNELKDLVTRARDNRLTGDELTGGTFTISNLGNYDIDAFTPIINLPESAILGVGRMVRKPIINERDEIVPASTMTLSLSFDHRVVDGALAAKFLKKMKNYLEDPDQMHL